MDIDWRIHLKAAIDARGMSQKTLAKRIGCSYNTWNNWMKSVPEGEPSISAAIRIADALDMTLDEVFRGIELEEPSRIDARLQAYFLARGIGRPPAPPPPPAHGSDV